ncbi:MAG: SOS response-associated peptidase [Clostridia bacterium]|nr:SOS response-associated peptidase [Clostridia bacterium]
MCGRFIIFSEAEEIEIKSIVEEINRKYTGGAAVKTGEIFPTDTVPVITAEKGVRTLSLHKWGFPGFKNSGVIINARSETLHEKPMFRNALFARRCLIPANGFFEWKKIGKEKQKHLIRSSEQRVFYMAGLYGKFVDKQNTPFTAFVIITTPASASMADIHERMPVILTDESGIKTWLDCSSTNLSILKPLMDPYERLIITTA